MQKIISQIKEILLEAIKKQGSDPYGLQAHLKQVERWANVLLKTHPKANKQVVILSVWLHDIGHYPLTEEDHAISGEKKAIQILKKNKINPEIIKQVAHSVRAHRCKDIMPDTMEARILACADSASHFTDFLYFEIAMQNRNKESDYDPLAKMERDYRDVALFPEIKRKLKPMYKKWKSLIREYQKLNY
ncbi:MAG: HD domain-containing protein [archaeon]